jgi:AICAR transformylase/IMP cyclohydrolase PurH
VAQHNIGYIDIVAVNLYPFRGTGECGLFGGSF